MEEAEKFAEKVPKRESGNETSSEGNSGGTRLSISGRFWSTLEVSYCRGLNSNLHSSNTVGGDIQKKHSSSSTTSKCLDYNGNGQIPPGPRENCRRDTTRGGRSLPDTERLNMEEEEVDHCSDI